jgi:ring-1,2-phenylacetyl-CoA epoxidase subunit PaaD
MVESQSIEIQKVYALLEQVFDPEIPVLSVVDLGVIRSVELGSNRVLTITITPTYSGCPAMDTIEKDIKTLLTANGYNTTVKTSIVPAWTTDWMSEKGKHNLEVYGIAPPSERTSDKGFLTGKKKEIRCPRCKSMETEMISNFGSTACKAMYKCEDCKEVFDYFKCI